MHELDIEKILQEMTLEEKARMCSGRDFWHSQDIERLGVPSVMMCDGPNGLRKQKGQGDHLGINESIETVCYPTSSAMASSFDRNLLRELGESLGEECQAEQVAMLLGPGINMKRSALCGRNFEYFSEDPYLAGELAAAYVQGLQSKGVAACVKHFAANNQETRRMSGSSNMSERTLHELYLPAFEKVVKEGKVRSVMCAYNAINGTYCSENKALLTDILRDKWKFDGFVVTDWGATKERVKGLQAGVDLEMPGGTKESTKEIIKAVEEGSLSEAVLDRAVGDVLSFVSDAMKNQRSKVPFDRDEAHGKSGIFARESAVLLKNEGVLPLGNTENTVFIGAFAVDPRYQGAGSSHIHVKHAISAMECVEGKNVTFAEGYDANRCENREVVETSQEGNAETSRAENAETSQALLEEAVKAAASADSAVIFAGLPEAYETEGCDREDMKLPENQNRLIHEVAKVQKNTVVVLHVGAPVELPWIDEVQAVLCMYLGGDYVGDATIDLLYGNANPSGKLAETWPLKLEDNPSYLNFPGEDGVVNYQEGIFIGYRYYDKKKMQVLFPFGHGLSYTGFAYSDLQITRSPENVSGRSKKNSCNESFGMADTPDQITDRDHITITCKVKNTGTCAGKEVVQLYISQPVSEVMRPVRELKGFRKIDLEPGEEKEVSFVLSGRDFAYYEEKIHDWYVPGGTYVCEIGSSSRDIRLKETVELVSTVELPAVYTENSTIKDLSKTKRGQALLDQILGGMGKGAEREAADKDMENLGAGSKRMMDASLMGMPLSAFVTYGRMTREALGGLLERLNNNEA